MKPKRLEAGTGICGSISGILKGLPMDENIVNSLKGMPIKNANGKIFGYIYRLDIENDTWYGEVRDATDDRTLIENLKPISVELRGSNI